MIGFLCCFHMCLFTNKKASQSLNSIESGVTGNFYFGALWACLDIHDKT